MSAGLVAEPVFSLTDAIGEAIGQELDAGDLKSLDIDREAVRQKVMGHELDIADAARVEKQRYDNCVDIQNESLKVRDIAWRRARLVRRCGYLSALGVWLGIQSLFELDWPIRFVENSHNRAHNTIYSLLIIVGACMYFFIVSNIGRMATGLPSKNLAVSVNGVEASESRRVLARKVQAEVASFVRVVINELQAAAEQLSGALLVASQARHLVELETSESLTVESLRVVQEFIREHSTSAIGIAGSRGVGKTTIIQYISSPVRDESIGAYIDTPVYYDAADFVRMIHAKVADAILRANRKSYIEPTGRAIRRAATLRALLSLIGIILGAFLIVLSNAHIDVPVTGENVVGGSLILASLVLYVSALLMMRSSWTSRARQQQADPVSLAQQALKTLRWQATVDTKASTKLKIFSVLETEDASDLLLAERERSHPERVADFKEFVHDYHETEGALPLIIAIDELDKIASPEKALELVNGLKDILHLPNTHFVVSVSEDALNSFALRGVPVRDVFDSSFDTVIHLRPLNALESIELLKGRVVGFPESAALLCHVLSGGLPRDLIRAARRCLDQRRAADKPVPVYQLGHEVPRLELLDVIEAALRVRRFAPDTPERKDIDAWLLQLREALRSGNMPMTGSAVEILKDGAKLCASLPSGSDTENILCIAAVLCTASQFMAVQRTSDEWKSLLAETNTQRAIDLLAEARMAAATFPAQCRSQVREARRLLDLVPDEIL